MRWVVGLAESSVTAATRIVVVEDDTKLRVLLTRILRETGYQAVGVANGRAMHDALAEEKADLVILDVMLPGTSGLDLCRQLHAQPASPAIVMLTARGDELDRVLGLELGADDYVCKPFSQRELLARVRAVLRRAQPEDAETPVPRADILRFAGWHLDLRRRELIDPAGALVDLSGAEHDLLVTFLENSQRVIGRERLLELSRTRIADASDRSVDVLVSRLRRKLGDTGRLIGTVRGTGYIFKADIGRR